jgi:bla regulator protein blaR1
MAAMAPLDPSGWQPEIEAVGWTLLHFIWQGLLVLIAYAATRRIWRTAPRLRLGAGHAAMLALAAAPAITLALRWPTAAAAGDGNSPIAAGIEPAIAAGAGTQPDWMPWLVLVWAFGVLLFASRAAWQWHTLRMICARARPLDRLWQQRMRTLADRFGMRRTIAVLESTEIGAPSLIGWLKPVVLLPAGLCLRLPVAQLELVLAHEIAHLRRHDHLINLLQVIVETALFYHPAVHWISRKLREDREQCCDDLVAEVCHARLDYARALLAVAEERSSLPRLAIAAGGGQLLARIERIVGTDRQRPRPLNERVMLGLGAALTVLLGLQTWPTGDDSRPLPLQLSAFAIDAKQIPAPVLGLRLTDLGPRRAPPDQPATQAAASQPPPATDTQASVPPPLPLQPLPRAAVDAPRALLLPPDLQLATLDRPVPVNAGMPAAALPAARPLRMEAPEYPRGAELRGIEGSVELSFLIDGRGRVTQIRVESGHAEDGFAEAAERALKRWRFAPADASAGRHSRTFDFRLQQPERDCVVPTTGSRICRPTT